MIAMVKGKRNWGLLGVGAVFSAVSVYFAIGIFTGGSQQRDAAANFEPVTATVLASDVVSSRTGNPGASGNVTSYQPRIEFQYEVDGKTHRSKRFAYLASRFDRETVEGIVERYPVGGRCTAYYNPAIPEQAILHRSAEAGEFTGAYVVAIVLVSTGLFMLVGGWRGWLRDFR